MSTNKPGRARKAAMWGILVLLPVIALEVMLSLYFFQRRSEFPSAIIHYASFAYQRAFRTPPTEALGIYQEDSRLGYRHRPGSKGVHRTDSFHVTYTIDSAGRRPTPTPQHPAGRILMLGSSFTFGFGVGDGENYPFLLASGAWRDWHVENRAVSGWGTAHAFLALLEELERPALPDLVIYNSIPDHVCRNYLRPAWLKMLAGSAKAHPHFELADGKPVWQRTAVLKDAVRNEKLLRARELALTEALVKSMHDLATARGARFVIALLPQRFEVACGSVAWPPNLIHALGKHGVAILDLSELGKSMGWLEHDAHPNRDGHRMLAEAFAGPAISSVLKAITRRAPGDR